MLFRSVSQSRYMPSTTRHASSPPTDKLLELLLKYNSQVKEEIVEPIYKSSQEIKEERQDRELLEELTTLQEPVRRLKVG